MSLEAISEALQKGKAKDVRPSCRNSLDAGVTAKAILEGGLMAGMDVVGRRFKANEIYVPEVLIAARAMTAGITILKPLLIDEAVEAKGTIVIGTVKGDLHDIGKNLVKMMMEGKGFNMIDLGPTSRRSSCEAARSTRPTSICCSALLTTTMTGDEERRCGGRCRGSARLGQGDGRRRPDHAGVLRLHRR
jgi:methanogenic corrinoid protein MtbC1